MTMRRPLFLACGLVLVASPLSAQRSERIASGVLFEHYGFEDGFIARETTQWLVPIATTVRFGSRASLALATGFTAVELATADSAGFGSRRITGPIDTDARLSVHLVPDRIIAIATAVLPTGQQTLLEDELLLPALLANDAIGYSAVSLGSGGSLGVGLSAAIPVGRFALGVAASRNHSFAFTPVLGETETLTPGAETRFRAGVEGPIARRTYFRLAASLAHRGADAFGDSTGTSVGRRTVGYVMLDQGVGIVSMTLYAFDVFRDAPAIENTSIGTGILPRSNLLGLGFQAAVLLSPAISIHARAEQRMVASAATAENPHLERRGSSVRAGADVRFRFSEAVTASASFDHLTGEVVQSSKFFGVGGYRAGLVIEVFP